MQNDIFEGTIQELHNRLATKHLIEQLSSEFKRVFGQLPSPSQERAWSNSLPQLLTPLVQAGLRNVQVVLEYRLPFDGERCDVIFLGRDEAKLKVLVVELKQWEHVEPHSSEIVLVPGIGLHSHPSYQAANYAGKIRNFHSLADKLEVGSICFLHNLSSKSPVAELLTAAPYAGLVGEAPIFFQDQTTKMVEFVSAFLGTTISVRERETFCSGGYLQSKQFFDGVVAHAADIANHVTNRIVGSGWGLSETQLKLKIDTLDSLMKNEHRLFLVQGEPGSGKTLVATHLFLEVLPTRKQVVLGLVNNRLMTALRDCLDKSYRGASGALKYFTPRYRQEGLANAPEDQKFDLVICDEGQRMSMREMRPILNRAPVVVVFYDEHQRLLPVEQGTRANFLDVARELKLPTQEYHLASTHRCKGGNAYQESIEQLLSQPTRVLGFSKASWSDRYDFRVFSSLKDMISELKEIQRDGQRDVCLLASFTESDGTKDNVRTKDPLLLWAMQTKEYVDFWVNRRSNQLDRCASIFGCQGFERVYAGVIWGRDYVFRGGVWDIDDKNTITDYIGNPSLLKLVQRGRKEDALELLYNRYRILLTRGIDGTFVFCEDEETREFLLDIAKQAA